METKPCENVASDCPGDWSAWGECNPLVETDRDEKGIKSRTNGVETEHAPCACTSSNDEVNDPTEKSVFGQIQVS